MQLIDTPPVQPFDATPFATYTSEEYATPTEAELVEDLPERYLPEGMELPAVPAEKPLRRGKGYLRAEITTADEPPSSEESDFGAGLEDAPPATAKAPPSGVDASQVVSTTSDSAGSATVGEVGSTTDASSDAPPKRRRKRSRRRGSKERSDNGGVPTSGQTGPKAEPAVADGSTAALPPDAGSPDEPTDGAAAKEKDGGPTGRKRKSRNRRRRGKGKGGATA